MSEPIREQLAKALYDAKRAQAAVRGRLTWEDEPDWKHDEFYFWADAILSRWSLSPVGETEAAKLPLDPEPFYGPQEGERWPSNSNGVSRFMPRRIFSQDPGDYR